MQLFFLPLFAIVLCATVAALCCICRIQKGHSVFKEYFDEFLYEYFEKDWRNLRTLKSWRIELILEKLKLEKYIAFVRSFESIQHYLTIFEVL